MVTVKAFLTFEDGLGRKHTLTFSGLGQTQAEALAQISEYIQDQEDCKDWVFQDMTILT